MRGFRFSRHPEDELATIGLREKRIIISPNSTGLRNMRGSILGILLNLFWEFHSQLSCSCKCSERSTMLLRPVKGINRGAAWREPRLCGIDRPFFDCPYPNPDARLVQL